MLFEYFIPLRKAVQHFQFNLQNFLRTYQTHITRANYFNNFLTLKQLKKMI